MKEVVISIHSVHAIDREDEDPLDFTTDGLYSYDSGVGTMSYYESEVTGLEGTRTCVVVKPDEIVVDRDGSMKSRMVFREGARNSFIYSTPYGNAAMGVDTRKIRHSFNEQGGSMEIDYILNMEHVVVTRNRFQLSVSELEPSRKQPC